TLPDPSVAFTVTVVVPIGKKSPDSWLYSISNPQFSFTATLKVTMAPHIFGSFALTISPGHIRAGSWLSCTVTVNVQVDSLPASSVAVAVTVVTPTGNTVRAGL